MKRRDFIHKTTLMTVFLTVTPHLFHAGNDSLRNNNADYVGELEKFVLPSDASKIFKVDDYGAKGDGRTDDTPAIQRTINAAIKKPGSVVLFSAKTYRLTHKMKKFALRLNNGENMIIHGNGATLLISPDTLALDINNCKNVMVRGFIIDYSPLPFMQGTVYDVNAQEGTFTMEVHKGYPIPSDAPFNSKLFGGPQMIDGKVKMNNGKNALGRGWGVIMEPKRRRFKRDVMNACRIRDYDILKSKAGKRRVKLKLHELSAKNIADIEIGDRFVLPLGMHAGGVMHITGGMENTLEDITVYSCPSLTFGAKQTERAVFRGIRVIFKPDSDRLITSCADGFHFRQNRRGSIIEDSLIEGQIDDSINIYCSANSIKKVISPKKYVLNNGTLIQKGDVLEAFEPLKGNSLGRVKVVSISKAKRDYTVELDQPIKGLTASNNRKKGQVFYNRTASGAGYIIRNNTFRYHRRYAMFLKPANGLVEGNKIYGLNGEGIVVANGVANGNLPRSAEGPYPENVIIRNNYIKDIENTGIEIRNRVFPRKTGDGRVVDGVIIENNTIEEWNGTAIWMGAVKNAVLTNNKIGPVKTGKEGIPVKMENCGHISIKGLMINGGNIHSTDTSAIVIDNKSDSESIQFED